MNSGRWAIIEGDPWRIVCLDDVPTWQTVEIPEGASPAEAAGAIAEALRSGGYRGEDVLLGLASGSCLAGSVDLAGMRRTPDRQALLYQFETALPVAAEDVVADFVLDRNSAFGVAARLELLQPIVERLEAEGIHILNITPWPLLAAQAVLESHPAASDVLVWENGERLEVFTRRDSAVAGWVVLPNEITALQRQLTVIALERESPPGVGCCGCAAGLADELRAGGWVCEVFETDTLDDVAARSAGEVLAGGRVPLIELRRDALASPDPLRPVRGLLRLTAAATAVCLLLAVFALQWRAARYEELARSYHVHQEEVFRQILPDQPVPLGVRSRLESEHARVSGIRGETAAVPETTSARPGVNGCRPCCSEGCWSSPYGAVSTCGRSGRRPELRQPRGLRGPGAADRSRRERSGPGVADSTFRDGDHAADRGEQPGGAASGQRPTPRWNSDYQPGMMADARSGPAARPYHIGLTIHASPSHDPAQAHPRAHRFQRLLADGARIRRTVRRAVRG